MVADVNNDKKIKFNIADGCQKINNFVQEKNIRLTNL